MTENDNINPLFAGQREKSGAETFSRYQYQYHYALYKALNAHLNANEYAVLIEYHEDVVFSNSLDPDAAEFEFNQVKTNDQPIDVGSMIKLKSGKSIIGKMIIGSQKFQGKMNGLNLVSANGFALELKEPELNLRQLYLSDLKDEVGLKITDALRRELDNNQFELPLHFSLVVPDLLFGNYRDTILATIVRVVSMTFHDSRSSPDDIYRTLIDELYSKGTITYDLKQWDWLLKSKALTSDTVSKVIRQFTNLRNDGAIQTKFESIVVELGLNSITKRNLSRAFSRYRLNKTGNRSQNQIDLSKNINEVIESVLTGGVSDMENLMKSTVDRLSIKTRQQFLTSDELDAAIILEYIDNHL